MGDLFKLELKTAPAGPVECLGMTFPNDEERRKRFLGIQRELSELQRKQRRQRQESFAVEDEIIAKRDELIASLQQRLQEKTSNETVFSVRWQVT